MMLNHLDLFSGIGGFALAARWVGGIRTIGFCDSEKYARQVLAKNFPGVPIYEDVRELHPDVIVSRDGRVDFLTCGFPCQDLSIAGNQKGIEAERSGLFFEITRLSDEILAYCGVRPSLVLENVPNLLAGDGGSWARAVYGELAVRGYCVEWKTLGATHVGAPHRRLRWWAVCYMANANGKQKWTRERFEQSQRNTPGECFGNSSADVADSSLLFLDSLHDEGSKEGGSKTSSKGPGDFGNKDVSQVALGVGHRIQGGKNQGRNCKNRKESSDQYPFRCSEGLRGRTIERGLGGMVDGIPDWLDEPGDIPRVTTGQKNRVSRLKGLGNAVVPQCAMIPLMRLKEILT
jgi:DNA (cytosine-5)-methyltransferase 1